MNRKMTGLRSYLPYVPLPEEGGDGEPNGGAGAGQGGSGSEYTPPATQADLDRIISERIGRERAKFADYPAMKAKAEAHDKALEDAKTEQERAVDVARKEGRGEALQAANARLVAAEARALAAEQKFRNPALAVRSVDLSKVAVNDAGEVDAEAIKTALKSLADADPYLLDDGKGARPKPDANQGGGKGGATSGALTGLSGNALYDRMHPKKTA